MFLKLLNIERYSLDQISKVKPRISLTGQFVQLSKERSFPGSTVSTVHAQKRRCVNLQIEQHSQLTRNILISTQRRNNSGFVGKNDLVIRIGWEKTLEQRNGRVENDCAFHSSLDADLDFIVVDQIGANTLNV